MSSTKEQIRGLIRKIIREEVKNIVQEEVNVVLAEKFMSSLSPTKQTLSEVITGTPVAKTKKEQSFSAPSRQDNREEMRKKILEKVGADKNPMMAMIYGDEDTMSQRTPSISKNGFVAPATLPQQTANGVIVDSDDEGIDISQFLGG